MCTPKLWGTTNSMSPNLLYFEVSLAIPSLDLPQFLPISVLLVTSELRGSGTSQRGVELSDRPQVFYRLSQSHGHESSYLSEHVTWSRFCFFEWEGIDLPHDHYLAHLLYLHLLQTQLQPFDDRLPILAREFPHSLIFNQFCHVIHTGSGKHCRCSCIIQGLFYVISDGITKLLVRSMWKTNVFDELFRVSHVHDGISEWIASTQPWTNVLQDLYLLFESQRFWPGVTLGCAEKYASKQRR